MYPLSWAELREHFGYLTAFKQLEQRVVYGMYPDVVNNKGDEEAVLKQLASSYLYKDILSLASMRQDTGALWENFLISERKKCLEYNDVSATSYFWRTTQKQEIDYIEERSGEILSWEFKWNPKAKVKVPKMFSRIYLSETKVIHRDNFEDFVLQYFPG